VEWVFRPQNAGPKIPIEYHGWDGMFDQPFNKRYFTKWEKAKEKKLRAEIRDSSKIGMT
jgi:hypothetical protein